MLDIAGMRIVDGVVELVLGMFVVFLMMMLLFEVVGFDFAVVLVVSAVFVLGKGEAGEGGEEDEARKGVHVV